MRRAAFCILIVAVAVVPLAGAVDAGAPDPAFGTGGSVVTDLGASEGVRAIALDREGRILIAGIRQVVPPGGSDWIVARYRADGTFDPAFDADGVALFDFFGSTDSAYDLAVQPDGKVVVVGGVLKPAVGYHVAVVRLNADGSLDGGFGSGGRALIEFGAVGVGLGVAVGGDGKIVVAGSGGAARPGDVVVARFDPAGALDGSFGTGGLATFDIRGPLSERAWDVVLQPDGRILLAGGSPPFVARLTGAGGLDTSFAGDGMLELAAGPADIENIALQPDGRIVVPFGAEVLRLAQEGALDTSFDGDGRASLPTSLYGTLALVLPDGRITVAGLTRGDPPFDFALARLEANGALDTSLDGDGVAVTDLGGDDYALAAALQPDGKVLVGGSRGVSGRPFSGDLALVRYTTSSCAVPNVVGSTEAAARRNLAANECTAGAVTSTNASAAPGTVVSQSQPPGATLADRATVDLVVSLGPKRAPAAPPALYKNCVAFNKKYPHGVGKVNARDKTTGKPVTTFKRSNKLYNTAMSHNKQLDPDRDGIACEKA